MIRYFFSMLMFCLLAIHQPVYAQGSDVTLRANFWRLESLPPSLQIKVLNVASRESNETYPFQDGAVSRDLYGELVESWRAGGATTISRCIAGEALVPGMGATRQSFSACPGQNQGRKEVYVEWKIPLHNVLNEEDPKFEVLAKTPAGCRMVYWSNTKDGGVTGFLSTRGNKFGNELRYIFEKTSSRIVNVNFILSCPLIVSRAGELMEGGGVWYKNHASSYPFDIFVCRGTWGYGEG